MKNSAFSTAFLTLGISLGLTLTSLSLPPAGARAAEGATPWVINQYTKSRLFVGGYDKTAKILHLGWQVSLKEGWKTYWRSPGEAGLPPRWTWGEARNIKSISVTWPVPKRLHIFDLDTFVYKHEVILPIEVAVNEGSKPVAIELDLDYMICDEICIPLEGKYRLGIEDLESLKISLFQKAQLERYQGMVPEKIPADEVKVVMDGAAGKHNLKISLPPRLTAVKDIIVEGPEGVMFGTPVTSPESLSGLDYKISYMGGDVPPETLLTLTIISGSGNSYEVTAPVHP